MKILIDMNLSPEWVQEFKLHNIEAVHWSSVGKFDAPDNLIMNWARQNNYIVFTHDLDLERRPHSLRPKNQALYRFGLKM